MGNRPRNVLLRTTLNSYVFDVERRRFNFCNFHASNFLYIYIYIKRQEDAFSSPFRSFLGLKATTRQKSVDRKRVVCLCHINFKSGRPKPWIILLKLKVPISPFTSYQNARDIQNINHKTYFIYSTTPQLCFRFLTTKRISLAFELVFQLEEVISGYESRIGRYNPGIIVETSLRASQFSKVDGDGFRQP